jgi:hypothetical protein
MDLASGGGGYDVRCGQFIEKSGKVCRTIYRIELQVAAGWRVCVGDIELIQGQVDCHAGKRNNF